MRSRGLESLSKPHSFSALTPVPTQTPRSLPSGMTEVSLFCPHFNRWLCLLPRRRAGAEGLPSESPLASSLPRPRTHSHRLPSRVSGPPPLRARPSPGTAPPAAPGAGLSFHSHLLSVVSFFPPLSARLGSRSVSTANSGECFRSQTISHAPPRFPHLTNVICIFKPQPFRSLTISSFQVLPARK